MLYETMIALVLSPAQFKLNFISTTDLHTTLRRCFASYLNSPKLLEALFINLHPAKV
jgi:hypothetical protein